MGFDQESEIVDSGADRPPRRSVGVGAWVAVLVAAFLALVILLAFGYRQLPVNHAVQK